MNMALTATALIEETDRARLAATEQLNQGTRGELGQFMTPGSTARLMASMFGSLPSDVRLLDAGAGAGSLTAAFVAEACQRATRPARITATAFELDSVLVPHLRTTMRQCNSVCDHADVAFTQEVHHTDFVESAVRSMGVDSMGDEKLRFNVAILNPPYCKIGTSSRERRLVQRVGLDATNLYAAFVALSIRLLEPGAQVVAIIPRSFCNGPYFRAFRSLLLDETSIQRIHVFDARNKAFSDDGVLQENIIVHAVKSTKTPVRITVSSSESADKVVTSRRLAAEEVVRESNGDRLIHLPTDAEDAAISTWMHALPHTLTSLGISVSTGRVVDFRAREQIHLQAARGLMPLIYPCHFSDGLICWPKPDARKPNAIARNADTESLFVPRGYYTVTKRFSSKEERRRLVAAVYDPSTIPSPVVGFENHLNYFHEKGVGLDADLAYGLMVYLNSSSIDLYFRQFNGHTQVNATDLRSLRFPSRATLARLGRAIRGGKDRSQETYDRLVLAAHPLPK